jgi:hypothetical protein
LIADVCHVTQTLVSLVTLPIQANFVPSVRAALQQRLMLVVRANADGGTVLGRGGKQEARRP